MVWAMIDGQLVKQPSRGIYRRRSDGRRVNLIDIRSGDDDRDSDWAIVSRVDRIGPQQRPYRLLLRTLSEDYTWESDTP